MMNSGIISKKIILRFFVIAIILSAFLSACGFGRIGAAEMDVTVYSGDQFDYKMTILIPTDILFMYSSVEEIEASLNEMVNDARNEANIKVAWKQIRTGDPNTYGYEINIPRTDISGDTNDMFTWTRVYHNNRNAYRIDFIGLSYISMYFESFTLNLNAGRILETNGTQVDSRTVTWVNPTRTPYAVVTPRSSVRWIPLVLGILLLGLLVLAVVILLVTGKAKAWGLAGINAGKWKIQDSKLSGQKKNIKQEKEDLISKLGKKAWEARVLHHTYTEPYFELEALDQQKKSLGDESAALDTELKQVRESYAKLVSEYAKQIGELQSQQKDVAKDLNQSKGKQSGLERELQNAIQHQEKTQAEIAGYHNKLAQVQASDSPEKETQAEALKNAIISLEGVLEKVSLRIPEIESELSHVEIEQKPFEEKISRLNDQIYAVQDDQKEALAPLEQKISEIEQSLKANNVEINTIQQKMTPLIQNLGPLVDDSRPYSEQLTDMYNQIDAVNANLESVAQEHGLVSTRLETSDKGAVRNFYLMIAGVLILFVLVLLFFVLVFV